MTIRGRSEGGTNGRESGCEVVEGLERRCHLKNGRVTTNGEGQRGMKEKIQIWRKHSGSEDEENVKYFASAIITL